MVAAATVPGIHQSGTHSARPAATAVTSGALYACSTHKKVYTSDGSSWSDWIDPNGATSGVTGSFEFVIDGGGSTIATGIKGDIYIPFACTITGVVLLADQSGSIVVNIWKSTYTAFDPTTHPAVGDKITASAPPTISTAKKSKDTTLTGWTTSLAADDVLRLNVDSVTSIQRVTVSIQYAR